MEEHKHHDKDREICVALYHSVAQTVIVNAKPSTEGAVLRRHLFQNQCYNQGEQKHQSRDIVLNTTLLGTLSLC